MSECENLNFVLNVALDFDLNFSSFNLISLWFQFSFAFALPLIVFVLLLLCSCVNVALLFR